MTTHLEKIPTITARLRHTHPDLTVDLDRIDDTADQLARWLPEARNVNTPSLLRSPSLEPHRSAGGHSDRTADHAVTGYADTGTTRRGNTGRLDQADGRIRDAHLALTYAPPCDPAGAIRVAQKDLDTALSLVHATLPKTYDPKRDRQDNGAPGCTSCARINNFSPTISETSGLCEWCFKWRRAKDTLPLLGILEARAQGRRITNRVIEDAVRAEHLRAKRRKVRR